MRGPGLIRVDPNIGRVIGGKALLQRMIGRGGVASVYHATDLESSSSIAVKLSHARITPSVLMRLREEANRLTLLDHPHALRTHDWGCEQEGRIYLVVELLGGCTLAGLLHGGRSLPVDETLRVVDQIASALGAAHLLRLVHGDLKPSNVMIDRGAKVSFGTSRLLIDPATGAAASDPKRILYKPIYSAPEQLFREKVDSKADVYSLGVLAYHCLAGTPPFSGTFKELRTMHAWDPLPPLDARTIPKEVASLVMWMLEKDPQKRPTLPQIRERISSCNDRALTALVNMPVRMSSVG